MVWIAINYFVIQIRINTINTRQFWARENEKMSPKYEMLQVNVNWRLVNGLQGPIVVHYSSTQKTKNRYPIVRKKLGKQYFDANCMQLTMATRFRFSDRYLKRRSKT